MGGLMVVVLHLPKLGEPSCPFHAVGTQIRMSSGGVGEAVGELPPQVASQLVGREPEGRGEDPHGRGAWASPSKLCWEQDGGSVAGPGDAQRE